MDSVNSGIGGTQGSFGDPATFAYPLGVNLDLPQAYDDDEYYEDEDELSDAQAEWEESLRQLEDLVSLILVPFAGKFFGRKFSNYCKFWNFVSPCII